MVEIVHLERPGVAGAPRNAVGVFLVVKQTAATCVRQKHGKAYIGVSLYAFLADAFTTAHTIHSSGMFAGSDILAEDPFVPVWPFFSRVHHVAQVAAWTVIRNFYILTLLLYIQLVKINNRFTGQNQHGRLIHWSKDKKINMAGRYTRSHGISGGLTRALA